MTEQYFIDLLQKIYPCKQPFTLVLTHRRYKTRLGTYNVDNKRIRIHDKDCTLLDCCYIAIHEYAHHLMNTEFNGKEYRTHGREFVFVNNVLVSMAVKRNLLPGDLTDRKRRGKADPSDDVISEMLKC